MKNATLKRKAKAALKRIPATAQRVLDRCEARDEAILDFLREAGRKGGKKRGKHPRIRELNRKAAEARWRKEHPAPKPIPK